MSSKFARYRHLRPAPIAAAAWLMLLAGQAVHATSWSPPFWRVARLSGEALACLEGTAEAHVEVLACDQRCAPIPWQLDERDAAGELALPEGPEPTLDTPPGVVDGNDELLWMASDAGRRMRADERPAGVDCGLEVELRSDGASGWIYVLAVAAPAPRSPVRYVRYDPQRDLVETARVAIGFGAPTPRYLAVRSNGGGIGPNALDRLKIRASARFLGLVPLGRDEDDIQWLYDAWRVGPIRIVRRERQWVRLGWGLRTPIFRTESYVYRDFVELPVRLRLNFPPVYFFRGIEVQAALDFRDMQGWKLQTAAGPAGVVGALDDDAIERLNDTEADWVALQGSEVTVVLRLQLGPSFASLRRLVLYRENDGGYAPESAVGEHPALGFRLTEWGEVDRGHHWFAAIATALPPGYDLDEFSRLDRQPLEIEARPLPPDQ